MKDKVNNGKEKVRKRERDKKENDKQKETEGHGRIKSWEKKCRNTKNERETGGEMEMKRVTTETERRRGCIQKAIKGELKNTYVREIQQVHITGRGR